MRQEAGVYDSDLWVHQCALFRPAVIGFVMLQAEVGDVIAQAEQKVIVAVMRGTEQKPSLLYQVHISVPHFLWGIERTSAIGGNVHFDWRLLAFVQRTDPEILTGDDGRIHQCVKRNWRKARFIP